MGSGSLHRRNISETLIKFFTLNLSPPGDHTESPQTAKMNVTIKTPENIAKMRIAGRLAADVLEMVGSHVKIILSP